MWIEVVFHPETGSGPRTKLNTLNEIPMSRHDDPNTRPPLDRMMTIHNLLSSNRYPNCTTLSDKLGVTPRTVQRDIEFMRDRWKLPIEYDSSLRGYRYTGPVDSLPTSRFNIMELRTLTYILRTISQNLSEDKVIHIRSMISKIKSLNGLPDEPEAA